MKIPFEVPKLNQLFKKNDNLSLEQNDRKLYVRT